MRKPSLLLFTMLLCICFAVSGCGKVSQPAPYEGSGYPHSYPKY